MDSKAPQLEDGYIKIATELFDTLVATHMSGNEWMVMLFVIRKTWGWNKKKDGISLTQFGHATGLSRPSVIEALDKLVGKKVLVVDKKTYINGYSFNKRYSEWVVPKKELVGFSVRGGSEKGTRVVPKKEPKLVPKKEHTINTINTNTINTNTIDNSNEFIALFAGVNPNYKNLFANKTQRLSTERLLKQFSKQKLVNLLRELPTINKMPYAPIITTPYELEVKMGKLLAFLSQNKIKANKGGVTRI